MKRTLYIYTTKSDRKLGRYKFGQTIRTAESRVKNQQTGNSEGLQLIYEIESDYSDHYIHDSLEHLGYVKVGEGGNEWFSGFKCDNEAVATLGKILSSSKNTELKEYIPRFYQEYVKMLFEYKLKKVKGSKTEFVLELAPRFGKTLWCLDLMITLFNDYGYKVCLLPAYVLTALSSFEKEFYTHKGFSDRMVFIRNTDNAQEIFEKEYGNKMIILPISLHTPNYQTVFEFISKLPSKDKVSFIDEADFGCHRDNSQDFIKFLDCNLDIYMTGTAIEKVISSLNNVGDNIIRWSYIDMLMVQNGEHPIQKELVCLNDIQNVCYIENIIEQLKKKYTLSDSKKSVKDIVIPKFMRLSLENVLNRFESFPEEYRTDWNKMLMDVNKSKGVLQSLIKSLFGVYDGDLTFLYDLDTEVPRDVTMIFANTPNKTQQNNLVKLIQEVLGGQYIVKLLNGDETTNRQSEKDAKKIIAQATKESKKVVFVSKDMASRSFSVSEIDTVMLLLDRGSYASVGQKISRVLTSGKTFSGSNKVFGNIISLSLDPNREDINPIDEYIIYESEKVDVNDLNDGIKRVLRSIQLFTNGKGGTVEIEKDVYGEFLINSSTLIKVGCETSKVDNIIVNVDLVNILLGVEVSETIKERLMGVDSSKIKRTYGDSQPNESKEMIKKIEDIRLKIKKVLDNIIENAVEISEINNCESDDIVDTLTMINNKGYCDEVVHEVGVNCDMVKQIIMIGGLSHKLLNTIISSYNKEQVVLFK